MLDAALGGGGGGFGFGGDDDDAFFGAGMVDDYVDSDDDDGDDSGKHAPVPPSSTGQRSAATAASTHSQSREGSPPPPSFSRLPKAEVRTRQAETVRKAFPRFPDAIMTAVDLEAGDALWLPAGWWHEVASYGFGTGPTAGHLALNYWFHPPDANSLSAPYVCLVQPIAPPPHPTTQ